MFISDCEQKIKHKKWSHRIDGKRGTNVFHSQNIMTFKRFSYSLTYPQIFLIFFQIFTMVSYKIVSYNLILRPLEYFEFKASPSLIFEPIYVLQSATSLSHILSHWFQSMKSDIKMILTLHMSRLLNIYFSKFKNSEVASVFLTTQTIYQLEPDVP